MNIYLIFRRFLDERGYERDFDEAFESQHPGYRLDACLWDLMGENEFVFGRAIDWHRTIQGHDFWSDVDKQWHLYVNEAIMEVE